MPKKSTKAYAHSPVSLTDIQKAAMDRWLKPKEIEPLLDPDQTPLPIMKNHIRFRPPSGSLCLFDRNVSCTKYKKDGYDWIKKSETSRAVREDHVKLKIKGNYVIAGVYCFSSDQIGLHRRAYYLLDPKTGCTKDPVTRSSDASNVKPSLVLLHYLDIKEASKRTLELYDYDLSQNSEFSSSSRKEARKSITNTSPPSTSPPRLLPIPSNLQKCRDKSSQLIIPKLPPLSSFNSMPDNTKSQNMIESNKSTDIDLRQDFQLLADAIFNNDINMSKSGTESALADMPTSMVTSSPFCHPEFSGIASALHTLSSYPKVKSNRDMESYCEASMDKMNQPGKEVMDKLIDMEKCGIKSVIQVPPSLHKFAMPPQECLIGIDTEKECGMKPMPSPHLHSAIHPNMHTLGIPSSEIFNSLPLQEKPDVVVSKTEYIDNSNLHAPDQGHEGGIDFGRTMPYTSEEEFITDIKTIFG